MTQFALSTEYSFNARIFCMGFCSAQNLCYDCKFSSSSPSLLHSRDNDFFLLIPYQDEISVIYYKTLTFLFICNQKLLITIFLANIFFLLKDVQNLFISESVKGKHFARVLIVCDIVISNKTVHCSGLFNFDISILYSTFFQKYVHPFWLLNPK